MGQFGWTQWTHYSLPLRTCFNDAFRIANMALRLNNDVSCSFFSKIDHILTLARKIKSGTNKNFGYIEHMKKWQPSNRISMF